METNDYQDRLHKAMKDAGADLHGLAGALGVSYQAVKKALGGSTKQLKSDNNVKAAHFLGVDSEWLATGEGHPVSTRVWPLSREVLDVLRGLDAEGRRKAENQLRAYFDMPPLERTSQKPLPEAA